MTSPNHYTRILTGLVTGMLVLASALVADERSPNKPLDQPSKPQSSARLSFTNSDPAVVAILSAEGIVNGEQVSRTGRSLGSLVVAGPMDASYPANGEERATLLLDGAKDAYRFVGSSECAGIVEVTWAQPILEGQIRAYARGEGGHYFTQAVSTPNKATSHEYLAVRGGANYRVQVLFSQGMDDSGNPATFSRTVETAVACDQIVSLKVGAPSKGQAEILGSADLYLGLPAELPSRPTSQSLLDLEDTTVKEFDNVIESGETSSCETDDFNDGDLSGWTFANVGDSNQGGAAIVGGRLQLTSDGTTYYHDGDNGGFVYQNLNGDFRAQVKITGFPVNAGGGYRKSGITIRTGTGPNDARVYASMLPLHPFYNQTAIMFDYRDAAGNEFELASTPLNIPLPAYLAVERRGNKFTVYFSTNGVSWTKPAGAAGGSVTIPMPGTVAVGMMQASYDANVTMTSEFDDFKVCRPNVIPLPPFPPHGVCAPGVPIDIVYLLDSTGSMTVPFDDGVTKLDAARNAMVAMNDLIETSLPGSRAALVTFRGGFTPAFNQTSAVTVLSNLTTDFDAVEAAAASIDVNAIHPDATTPISIALDRTLTVLQNQTFINTPIVVFIGDGWANIDFAGNGPLEYLRSEMGAISIIQSGNFIPWGAAAWLGNWNSVINTYDGEPLANAMYQTLRMKSTMPSLVMFTVGVNSGDYRPDLLSFMALYTGGDFYQVNSATEMLQVLEGIYDGVDCGAEVGDTVWNDLDGNGVQDGGEPGLAGVTVELVDDNGDVVATEVTDSNGNYLFTAVFPGIYTVRVVTSTLPSGIDVQTYDYDGLGTANAATVTVVDDQAFLDADFGYRAGASTIGDRVWNDADGDGFQDGGEVGFAGVTVELVDGNGVVVATDITDGNGNYLFEDVASGNYTVRVVPSSLPSGATATYDRDGIASLHTAAVTVCCDQTVLDVDFGYRLASATIGDRVWNDADGDGVQDGGETGFAGVVVELVNSSGVVVATDTTDSNGNYLFENVASGTYTVRVVSSGLPSGATATFDRDGIATLHTAVVTVTGTQVVLDADFGYRVCAGWIGDRVWDDKDGDGVQDSGETGIPGVILELVNSSGTVIATRTTNSSGNYNFNNVAPGTYTVRVVTSSLPPASTPTFDKDGVITPHQATITITCDQKVSNVDFGYRECAGWIGDRVWDDKDGDGVQDSGEVGFPGVTVELVNSGGTVIATDVTDSSGKYSFDNVAPGTYTVRVVASTLPANATATYDKDGIVTPHQATLTITCNQKVSNIDFGYRVCDSGKIGDKVWWDKNKNGSINSGEPGIAGVTVELLNGSGVVIATDVTDANGIYLFEGLGVGTYTVRIVASTLPPGAGATFDRDGTGTLHTATTTLTCNQSRLNLDFGYDFPDPANITGCVWDDKNGDGKIDSGEIGIPNVTVELLDSNGNVVATDVTDSSGFYSFNNLAPGTYTVRVVTSTLPSGLIQTYDYDGLSSPHQATVTVAEGETNNDLNFGYWTPPPALIAGCVWEDLNGDGKIDSDAGETGIANVTIELLDANGNVIATDVTAADGTYSFEDLVPGTYTVRVVPSTLPPDMLATYDWDGIQSLHEAIVVVAAWEENWDVNFGYQDENNEGAWCPRTPGFWKTHPEVWPVSSLTFGGVTYNTTQLMTFLNYGGSDAATRLAHHLTATMLNLAMGSDASTIQTTVNQASTFLVTWPPGSNPTGAARTQANNLKNLLDKYNNDPACH